VLADDDVDLVVTVGVPADRGAVAIAALEAGKAVLSAKPGVTARADLDRIRELVAGRPGRPWTVLFSERFENRAVARAVAMARAGAVGRVVHVTGTGPHALHADMRPEWFWDPERSGGILVDLASHQVDQFLAICGDPAAGPHAGVAVDASRVGNVACPDRPAMQDVGSITLVGDGAVGDHRVDLLSPPGLPTWGDVRLTIVGTEGTLEVRANIDVAGEPGGEHLIVTDGEGVRRVDVSADPLPWAEKLLADLADGGERLMTQEHVLAVCDLTIRAQEQARPWGAA
jgi:predicted dehydrogenase